MVSKRRLVGAGVSRLRHPKGEAQERWYGADSQSSCVVTGYLSATTGRLRMTGLRGLIGGRGVDRRFGRKPKGLNGRSALQRPLNPNSETTGAVEDRHRSEAYDRPPAVCFHLYSLCTAGLQPGRIVGRFFGDCARSRRRPQPASRERQLQGRLPAGGSLPKVQSRQGGGADDQVQILCGRARFRVAG